MMKERIKQIGRVLHELCYFRRIIKKYGNDLLPGRYYLFPSLRAIAADNPATMEKAKLYFEKKVEPSKTQALIAKANQMGCYRNKKKGNAEKYEAVYSANNYDKVREIKLFSFERNEILTICTCAEAWEKQLAEYESLHTWFGMPCVTNQEKYEHAYKISMVKLLSRSNEQYAMENIARCVTAYDGAHRADRQNAQVLDITQASYDSEAMNRLLAKLAEQIDPALQDLEIPMCFQHGDLSRDNLLYGTCDEVTDFWWIDWEHARHRLFFYDYFFYMLNTAVYFSDTTALDAYLSGAYDVHLREWFAEFGLAYEAKCRKSYFLIFAIAFLKERVCDRGNGEALEMYVDFINETVLKKE